MIDGLLLFEFKSVLFGSKYFFFLKNKNSTP